MSREIVVCIAVTVFSVGAWASQPGHPIDCSDWVPEESGLKCRVVSALNALPVDSSVLLKGTDKAIDNSGRFLFLKSADLGSLGPAPNLSRLELLAFDGSGVTRL